MSIMSQSSNMSIFSETSTVSTVESPPPQKKKRKTEDGHQSDAYWVLGLHCPLCREKHMSLRDPWIPLIKVLEAYPENSELIQELKTQCFTSPIPWNNTLKFPDKSIVVEA
ncbi:2459_t:CDS:2 [Entrophospora sp. SA101]|nr:2459_t:CDS:2 [Entrophospora sp. SA101]CAJ0849617.1 17252_t:CDS:2 [Entrophospora sp. SA101]CAJ0849624.1 17253_t:CDS:2 [Entrophospora sp. SA101]CAJ0912584.1 21996_t:CDS:2 [Entrophospora sp. SA101]